MFLKDMKPGEHGTVENINLPFQMERRLQALGMTKQTEISVLNKKGRGIVIVKIRGTRFALGYQMAKNIGIKKVI